jgi:hypothetical protein
MRHLKVMELEDVDEAVLGSWIREAVALDEAILA